MNYKKKPSRLNRAKSLVMTPLYKLRVVRDKTKYNRKKINKLEEIQ
jgi:stalled ribosome alternative rescue factor ArfA